MFIDDEQVQSYIASGKAAATTFSEVWIVFDNRRRSAHTKATMTGMLGSPKAGAGVAVDTLNVHTPIMTLKNVALLALIGTILMTALLVWTFVFDVLNALRGLVPAVMLFSSFIYAFGCFSVALFFYVFHRAQS